MTFSGSLRRLAVVAVPLLAACASAPSSGSVDESQVDESQADESQAEGADGLTGVDVSRGPRLPSRVPPPVAEPSTPPTPSTTYCAADPACTAAPGFFYRNSPIELALFEATCRNPLQYAPSPDTVWTLRATLCPDTQEVRDIVAKYAGGTHQATLSRTLCNQCLAAPAAGTVWVVYRPAYATPLCPTNCRLDRPL